MSKKLLRRKSAVLFRFDLRLRPIFESDLSLHYSAHKINSSMQRDSRWSLTYQKALHVTNLSQLDRLVESEQKLVSGLSENSD